MPNTDAKIDDHDVIFEDGDFLLAESDVQHIEDTINAFPGWWKQHPVDGVGIRAWMNGSIDKQGLSKYIRLNLQSDGYTVNNPTITLDPDGTLIINPNASL